LSVYAGKWYFEGTVTDEGLCRLGWSTGKASLDLGTDKFAFGFGGTGKKSWGKQFDSYGEVSKREREGEGEREIWFGFGYCFSPTDTEAY
jgi:hypothetical protein